MFSKIQKIIAPAAMLLIASFGLILSQLYNDYFYLVIAIILDLFVLLIRYSGSGDFRLSQKLKKIKLRNNFLIFLKLKNFKLVFKDINDNSGSSKSKNISKKYYLINIIFLVGITLFISHFLIFTLEAYSKDFNLSSYFYSHLKYPLSVVSAILIFLFLFNLYDLLKEKHIKPRLYATLSSTAVFVASIVFSIIFVMLFAGVEISFTKYKLKNDSASLKVYTDISDIKQSLSSVNEAPNLIGSEQGVNSKLIALVLKNRSDFYKKNIVQFYTDKLPFNSDINSSPIILVDNNLLVTKLEKRAIEDISPVLGKLMVEKTFAPRYIKDVPQMSILGRQEYLKYRDEKIAENVEELNGYLDEVQHEINLAYGEISNAKASVANYEAWMSTAYSNRDSAYNSCVSAVCYTYSYSYYTGYTSIPYACNTSSYCDSQRASWDNTIAQNQSSLQEWKNYLSSEQKYLADLLELEELYSYYISLVESQKDQTVYELGLFEPDNQISIVLEQTDTKSLADFYATVIHEYLHYTSYVSEERYLDKFFEEGLTEYFARKATKDSFSVDTNLGYPLITKLISKLAVRLPEDQLEEVYFNKDQDMLIALLNQEFGEDFYAETEPFFSIIYYLPAKDALEVANDILFKIGESELSEEDLFSSTTDF